VPFRDAHRVVGQIVARAVKAHRGIEDLSLDELHQFSPLFEADVFDHLTLEGALRSRDVLGGTAPIRVREALANVKT
jgi:argininosuccinate lyase